MLPSIQSVLKEPFEGFYSPIEEFVLGSEMNPVSQAPNPNNDDEEAAGHA